MLPQMVKKENLVKQQITTFGGYNHNPVIPDGELYDMENLTATAYPLLSPRQGRTLVRTLVKPNGLFSARGKLGWVDGSSFYYDGQVKGQVTDSKKQFARLGPYVLVFPDKSCYNTKDDTFVQLEATWKGSARFTNYTYDAGSGEAKEVYRGNAITTTATAFPFEPGEAVTITGSSIENNNRTSVIREIANNGKTLVFSNETFTEGVAETLTIQRQVPDMDFLCENENRLWGCHDNEIYACALGNPFRWHNLEGLATDSYAVSVGTDGPFTGAASYLGYAMFFKADAVHKIYGSKPSNFQAMTSAVSGVAGASAASLAVAGEVLFYLSPTGIVSYTGGIPSPISSVFGRAHYTEGTGGSDGRNYYVSLRQGDTWTLFCYDSRSSLWHKQDHTHVLAFARQDGILYLLDANDNSLYSMDTANSSGLSWFAETGDFTEGTPNQKGVGKLQIRLEADVNSSFQVSIMFDSDGQWQLIHSLKVNRKRTFLLPIIPRRCDHYRLRLSGSGSCRVFSVSREFYGGSER